MAQDKCAMAESVMASIVADDVDDLATALSTTDDRDTWRAVLHYQLPIEQLIDVDGMLLHDVYAPRLLRVGCAKSLTPWHVAALRGAGDALSIFVEHLALPVDYQLPNSGATALQLACFAGHTDTVRMLVDQLKADINQRDEYDWTALHYAAVEGQFGIVELLLAHDVDVTVRDRDGVTAAYRAHASGHRDVVSLIQSVAADTGDVFPIVLDDDDDSATQLPEEQLYANAEEFTKPATTGNVTEKRESELVGLGQIIGEEFREFLEEDHENGYLTPVDYSSVASNSHFRLDDVSSGTFSRVVREQLRRVQANARAHGYSYRMCPSRSRENDEYEELSNCKSLGVPQFAAPPPPSRRQHASPTTSPTINQEKNRLPVVRSQPPGGAAGSTEVAGDGVRQRRKLIDDHTQLIGRIEQSSDELDVLFRVLAEVGLRHDGDWQRLARELPICKPGHISQIEARYGGDTKRQAMAALADWRSYSGSRATIDELTAALERCQLHEEAQLLTCLMS